MIKASELKTSMSEYQKLKSLVESTIVNDSKKGRTESRLNVKGSANIAESLIPELNQCGYLAKVRYGNTSEGRGVTLHISWARDTSSPPGFWESLIF